MKYADTIQTLARKSCDVAAYIYDRTYIEWREYDYKSLPWDQVNNELYNLSKNIKSLPFPVSGVSQRSSKKYCYSFNNNDGRCERGQNCKYPHVCEKCGEGHFKRLCRQPYKGKSKPKFNNRPKNDNVPNKT